MIDQATLMNSNNTIGGCLHCSKKGSQVGEVAAGGFVVGLQQHGDDTALCRNGILHCHIALFSVCSAHCVHVHDV